MAKTPMNATEYLKSLLGIKIFRFSPGNMNPYFLDFASDTIPSTKHNDTPCKFR